MAVKDETQVDVTKTDDDTGTGENDSFHFCSSLESNRS